MERIKRAINSPQGERFRKDTCYRAQVMLAQGLISGFVYTAVKTAAAIAYRSIWFGVLAVYDLLLAAMRMLLVDYVRRTPVGSNPAGEWRRCRLCGFILLAMNQALAAVTFRVAVVHEGFRYPGVLIYAMAVYAFYAFIIAIVNMARFRRYNSPVLSSAKAVGFVSAMVSMFALEAAMLAEFSREGEEFFRQIMISLTGVAICAAVLAIAVYMIVKSTRALRALK